MVQSGVQAKRALDNTTEDIALSNAKRQNMGNKPLLKLLVPNYVAGALIGKGGEALNDLKTQYGGFVRLSGGKEYYPGTSERVVVVTGETSELTDINNHIMVKVENPGRDSSLKDVQILPARCDKVLIVLTDLAAGLLIGRAGGTIKAIQEESEAKLSVAMTDTAPVKGERVLTISGTFEQRGAACALVIEKVSGDASNKANTRLRYDSGDSMGALGGMMGGGGGGSGGYGSLGAGGYPGPQSHMPSAGLKARVTVEVDVADALVGPIMGKQGAIVKDMVQRSGGARFKFADKSLDATPGTATTRTLTITGDMKQCQSAYLLVGERIAQIEKESQRYGGM